MVDSSQPEEAKMDARVNDHEERQVELMTSIMAGMVELKEQAAEGASEDQLERIMRSIERNITRLAYPSSDEE